MGKTNFSCIFDFSNLYIGRSQEAMCCLEAKTTEWSRGSDRRTQQVNFLPLDLPTGLGVPAALV